MSAESKEEEGGLATTYNFICVYCKYEGTLIIKHKVWDGRKKEKRPFVVQDNVVIGERCWLCYFKHKGLIKE